MDWNPGNCLLPRLLRVHGFTYRLRIGACACRCSSHPPRVPWLRSQIESEEVPIRTVIGKTETVTWAEVAPIIARMRGDARQHFASTGAQGGRELTSFLNQTPEGADVLVGGPLLQDGTCCFV